MWTIWKERNKRIFKDQSSSLETIWNNVCQNLKETLILQTWHDDDLPSLPQEKNIWDNWNLQWNQELKILAKSVAKSTILDTWLPPPQHVFQLNFDGASKGNPGKAEFGGIFRDHNKATLINMVNKILQGSPSNKIGNSWQQAERLELVEIWLKSHRAVNFKHIRREGNKVADLLANIGGESSNALNANALSTIATET